MKLGKGKSSEKGRASVHAGRRSCLFLSVRLSASGYLMEAPDATALSGITRCGLARESAASGDSFMVSSACRQAGSSQIPKQLARSRVLFVRARGSACRSNQSDVNISAQFSCSLVICSGGFRDVFAMTLYSPRWLFTGTKRVITRLDYGCPLPRISVWSLRMSPGWGWGDRATHGFCGSLVLDSWCDHRIQRSNAALKQSFCFACGPVQNASPDLWPLTSILVKHPELANRYTGAGACLDWGNELGCWLPARAVNSLLQGPERERCARKPVAAVYFACEHAGHDARSNSREVHPPHLKAEAGEIPDSSLEASQLRQTKKKKTARTRLCSPDALCQRRQFFAGKLFTNVGGAKRTDMRCLTVFHYFTKKHPPRRNTKRAGWTVPERNQNQALAQQNQGKRRPLLESGERGQTRLDLSLTSPTRLPDMGTLSSERGRNVDVCIFNFRASDDEMSASAHHNPDFFPRWVGFPRTTPHMMTPEREESRI
ncbi:uncharacterized protein CLUP02_09901 [Colletotrichum lupini]|uniref:Uncharacterized protein n=1 Tax=Colletotrichum lupini TaxID=145971 RepID=A0A9Q8SVL2_9PEZI|nr:uncharacterized protein CLUP02_09901 [Colletotrichum lupini]UQC84404.1 hypothetical protein CLUP02_09901 [Colletotrichum lupini]